MTDVRAKPQVYPPLQIGRHSVETPVVLAPMAGVTNTAYRRLCREQGRGYYVTQMVTARALMHRSSESMRLIEFEEDEFPRSLQLYTVDVESIAGAVRMIATEGLADHIDLNFGCPVAKVTRKGGGSALPWKLNLFRSIVATAVREAQPAGIPVTIKMRKGIDDAHLTYLDAARIAEDEGVSAIALHARTAVEHYSGHADWSAIAALKETIRSVPVLGNGDIWSAEDALAMMQQTGCDGVVVGRGCLGRPWLFADLQAAFAGSSERTRPNLDAVVATMKRHAQLLVQHFGNEEAGCRDFRKHVGWYLKGYSVGGDLRGQLFKVENLKHLQELCSLLDLDQPYPGESAEGTRGRQGSPKRVALPDGWLDDRCVTTAETELLGQSEADGGSGG